MANHKHFYNNIIIIDSIHIGLDSLDLDPHEKEELVMLAENNIHHKVLDIVLTELEESDKKTFLALVLEDNHPEIWKLLKEKVSDAEAKISKAANEFIALLHEDIKEAHKKKQ